MQFLAHVHRDEPVETLSIGSVVGGVTPRNRVWRDAIRRLAVQIAEARSGIAGHADALRHNLGETQSSRLTSWSTDMRIAERFAGRGGVVLQTSIESLRARNVNVFRSPDLFRESEWLVEGTVDNLGVFRPLTDHEFDKRTILRALARRAAVDPLARTAAQRLEADERTFFRSGETSASSLHQSLSIKLDIAHANGIDIAGGDSLLKNLAALGERGLQVFGLPGSSDTVAIYADVPGEQLAGVLIIPARSDLAD